jgi:hypothetical protein
MIIDLLKIINKCKIFRGSLKNINDLTKMDYLYLLIDRKKFLKAENIYNILLLYNKYNNISDSYMYGYNNKTINDLDQEAIEVFNNFFDNL